MKAGKLRFDLISDEKNIGNPELGGWRPITLSMLGANQFDDIKVAGSFALGSLESLQLLAFGLNHFKLRRSIEILTRRLSQNLAA